MKFGFATALILAVSTGCGSAAPPNNAKRVLPPSQEESRPVVEFSYQDLQGAEVTTSQFKGRVVVISYFATWCTECLEQLPRFNALLRDLSEPEDLEVIAVSVDLHPKEALPPVLAMVRPRFAVVVADQSGLYGSTPMGTLSGVPTTFLIDKEGYLNETLKGQVPMPYLRRRVLELLEGS